MAEWLRLREQQVVRVFGLEREMVPSLNTIRRTLAETVTATELQTIFRRFLHQVYELVALYEAFGFEIRHRRGQAVIAVSLTPSIDTSLT